MSLPIIDLASHHRFNTELVWTGCTVMRQCDHVRSFGRTARISSRSGKVWPTYRRPGYGGIQRSRSFATWSLCATCAGYHVAWVDNTGQTLLTFKKQRSEACVLRICVLSPLSLGRQRRRRC